MSVNVSEKPHGDLNLSSDSIEKALASVEEALMSIKEALGTTDNSGIIEGNGVDAFYDQEDEINFKPMARLSNISTDSIGSRVNQRRTAAEEQLQKGQQQEDIYSVGDVSHAAVANVAEEHIYDGLVDKDTKEESVDKDTKEESVEKDTKEESVDKREAEESKGGVWGRGDVELVSNAEAVSPMERTSDKDLLMPKSTFELTKSSAHEMVSGAETVEMNEEHQGKDAGKSSNNVDDFITEDDTEEDSNDDTEERDMKEVKKTHQGNKGKDVTESKTCPRPSSTSSSPPPEQDSGMSQSLTNRRDPARNVSRASSGWKNPDDDYEDNEEERAFRRRIEREDLIIEHVAIAVCVALAAFLIYVMFIR